MTKEQQVSVHIVTKPDEELEFYVKDNIKGKQLFDTVCRAIGLREWTYFGLYYQRPSKPACWLRMDKKISKQLGEDILTVKVYLRVQYYPEYVEDGLLLQLTQHLFFLHVKSEILSENVYCPVDKAALMASYAVQAKYGDYDKDICKKSFLANEQILPSRITNLYQLTDDQWEDRIVSWYSEHCCGLSRSEAELEYLKLAQDLEMYGVCFYKIQNNNQTNLWFGIHQTGINIYEECNKLIPKVAFLWSEIKNINFRNKQLWIQPMENKIKSFTFISVNVSVNREILLLASGNHERYMKRRQPDSLELQIMKSQAEELHVERQRERNRFMKEKKIRIEAEKSKNEFEKRLKEYQTTLNHYRTHLQKVEETTDLLGEKALVAEEESMLLLKKAAELESEIKRLHMTCNKKEKEKNYLESHIQNADMTIQQILQDSEMRARESNLLRQELDQARQSEKTAIEKLFQMTGNPQLIPYITQTQRQTLIVSGMIEGEATEDIKLLQKERVDYLEKSHHLQQQLTELKSEIEGLKITGNQDMLDRIHFENIGKGETKYSTMQKLQAASTNSRVQVCQQL